MIADNLKAVIRRIAESCGRVGRQTSDITLICVTKEASIGQIEEALALGVNAFGENRVQDAIVKFKTIGGKAAWHLVGHLQTNKIKDAVSIFSLIHSIDSVRLAKEIDKEAARLNKKQDILVQVNVSGEASKFGIASGETEEFIKNVSLYPNINIKGLMTIAPEADDPEKVRPFFRKLRELRDAINAERNTQNAIRILSMGMSDDFEVAIEEGSNMVRIGRAIFK